MHECRELEEVFGTHFIDMIPQAEEGGILRHSHQLKNKIMREARI